MFFAGATMAGGGVMLSAVYPNLIVFLVAYGLIGGFGVGLVEVLPLSDIWIYFKHNMGRATGFIFIGVGVGPAVYAALFTFIVNPGNQEPSDTRHEGYTTNYYFPESIYDRCPYALLALGALIGAFGYIGLACFFPVSTDLRE
jgi:MFS family permease